MHSKLDRTLALEGFDGGDYGFGVMRHGVSDVSMMMIRSEELNVW